MNTKTKRALEKELIRRQEMILQELGVTQRDLEKQESKLLRCSACENSGFILADGSRIVRCDACSRFKTDAQAVTAAFELALARKGVETPEEEIASHARRQS